MLGEKLEPLLPQLAALQRDGVVSTEKVAIVERAMHKLSRHDLDPEAVETAEQLLTDHAAILAPPELRRFAHAVVNAADPDGPQPVDDPTATGPPVSGVEAAPGRHVASRRPTHQHRRYPTQRDPGPIRETPHAQRSKIKTAPASTSPTSGRRCNACTTRWRRPAPSC